MTDTTVPDPPAQAVAPDPYPFPGEDLAERKPGGGWQRILLADYGRLPLAGEEFTRCSEPPVYAPAGYTTWKCNAHVPGWHVAALNYRGLGRIVVAVWPDEAAIGS